MVVRQNGVAQKRKTTVLIDQALWKSFVTFVVEKHGTAKRTSEELELAMKEYLQSQRK